jgi:hypothetical protein
MVLGSNYCTRYRAAQEEKSERLFLAPRRLARAQKNLCSEETQAKEGPGRKRAGLPALFLALLGFLFRR